MCICCQAAYSVMYNAALLPACGAKAVAAATAQQHVLCAVQLAAQQQPAQPAQHDLMSVMQSPISFTIASEKHSPHVQQTLLLLHSCTTPHI